MTTEQMIEEAAQRIMDKAHHEVVYGNLSFVPDYLEALVKKELTTIATKAAEAERKRVVNAAVELAEFKVLNMPIGTISNLVVLNKEQYKMFLLEALGNI